MPEDEQAPKSGSGAVFGAVLVQIALMDMIFSLDSVITAVGMAEHIWVMAAAIIIAMIGMIAGAERINSFIHKHPTLKMLALSFLLLIGTALVAEGLAFHIPKGYIYFSMAFSLFVEMLNLGHRRKVKKIARPKA